MNPPYFPERPRVVLVTNMLPPYRIAFYDEIARHVELTVVLDTLSEFNRAWKASASGHRFHTVIQNCRSFIYKRHREDVHYTEPRQFHFSEKTYGELRRVDPVMVVTAEFGFRTLWSLFYGWLNAVPVAIYSEGTCHTEGHVGWLKRLVRRLIVCQSARLWSNGPESTKLLLTYGADPSRIDEGMTGIDTADWKSEVARWRERRDDVRAELGLHGRVVLFSGSLSPRKGIAQMLEAIGKAAAAPDVPPFSMLILGDGEDRKGLESWKAAHPQITVVSPGFVQHPELPRYFAAADWAVLPTLDDNWPLATLETLVAGLPQLFSVYNGATADLCHADTGLSFDPLDPEGFAAAFLAALKSPLERVPEERIQFISDYYSAVSQGERAAASVESVLHLRGD